MALFMFGHPSRKIKNTKMIKNEKDNLFCYDCKKEIKLNGEELVDAVLLGYKDGLDDYRVIKCKACYEKHPELANFRKCEVYSRIVGYIRPVNQWNDGKQAEYADRKEYKITEI